MHTYIYIDTIKTCTLTQKLTDTIKNGHIEIALGRSIYQKRDNIIQNNKET